MNILKKLKVLFLSAITILAIDARGDDLDKNKITISGSDTFDREILNKEHEIESKTGFVISSMTKSSLDGIKDLVDGKANLAMTAASLDTLSKKMHKYKIDTNKLKEFEIKEFELGFFVNTKNKVNSLTFDQIKKIYSGEIKNWKEVGGDDAKILVLSRGKYSGTEAMLDEAMGIKSRGKNVKDNLSARKLVLLINNVPNAISAYVKGSAWPNNKNAKELKTDKTLKQKLYIVTKGEPNEAAKKIIDAAREVSKD